MIKLHQVERRYEVHQAEAGLAVSLLRGSWVFQAESHVQYVFNDGFADLCVGLEYLP